MKKNYNLILAALALLFAGCASEELSEVVNPEGKFANSELIQFSTLRQNSTRADLDGEEAALKLNKQFYVYGEKSSAVTPVFPSFLVKWQGTSTTTDTNTKGWEYVLTEKPEQTVRYWDYAADNYKFIAWSSTTNDITPTDVNINGFKVAVTSPDDISKFYIAEKNMVEKENYQKVVTLKFASLASKVRIAFYEEIPGYSVSDIVFRYNRVEGYMPYGTRYSDNAILDGSFNSAEGGTFTVTYPDSAGKATVALPGVTPVKRHDFGTFTRGEIGTSRTEATFAGNGDYELVMPNEDNAGDMYLAINYTLVSDDHKDTLRVKGAHVTIPASAVTWHPNYAYTYYFKLTKDTNGTTGRDPYNPDPNDGDDPYYPDPDNPDNPDPGPNPPGPNPFYPDPIDPSNPDPDPTPGPFDPTDPTTPDPYDPNNPDKDVDGLYPIVFDAVVVEFQDATEYEKELKDE